MKKLNKIRENGSLLEFLADGPLINDNFRIIQNYLGLGLEFIYPGEEPNDCTGDTIREACQKINRNFEKIHDFLSKPKEADKKPQKPNKPVFYISNNPLSEDVYDFNLWETVGWTQLGFGEIIDQVRQGDPTFKIVCYPTIGLEKINNASEAHNTNYYGIKVVGKDWIQYWRGLIIGPQITHIAGDDPLIKAYRFTVTLMQNPIYIREKP